MTDQNDSPKLTQADVLANLADDRYTYGVTPAGKPFAAPKDRPHIVRMFKGSAGSLRNELAKEYRKAHGKAAGGTALADALTAIQGDAEDNDPTDVFTRVARTDDATVWVDMGDTAGRVLRIDADGWDIVSRDVPVKFTRTTLTGMMTTPERGGDIADLWELLNVSEADRPLVLGWMVATLINPDIPHPILAVMGEQGTGKSSASSAIISMVDPSPSPMRKSPKDEEAWVTAAQGSWAVGLDNLSAIPAWLSDALCRAVTGDSDVRRRLHTDGDLEVFSFRRCILLNGIDVGAMRADLADRVTLVNLDVIPEHKRRRESDLAAAWQDARPRLLGALLDQVAATLATLPTIHLERAPRMADFADILAALDKINGTEGLTRYMNAAETMATDAVEADPFMSAVMDGITDAWTGSASELLDLAEATARAAVHDDGADKWRKPRGWPTTPRKVTSEMKRLAPALRKLGWTVDDAKNSNTKRTQWSLRRSDDDRRTTAAQPQDSRNTSSQVRDGFAAGAAVAAVPSPQVPTSDVPACDKCGEPLDQPGALARCRAWHTAA